MEKIYKNFLRILQKTLNINKRWQRLFRAPVKFYFARKRIMYRHGSRYKFFFSSGHACGKCGASLCRNLNIFLKNFSNWQRGLTFEIECTIVLNG